MVKVAGLYRVGLSVPDLERASRFYEHAWSMLREGGDAGHCRFRSPAAGHCELTLHAAAGAGLDHLALAVRGERQLAQLLERVETAGGAVVRRPAEAARDGEALSAAVRDADGNLVELVVPAAGAPGYEESAARGRRLGHVVLWTADVERQEAFYGLLGFGVSDRTHMGMSFLRCNTDHHSVALARSPTGRTGLQHVAFDVGTIDDVMREYGRLREQGEHCIWGVGRHGPGNNVFAYYTDPAGNVVEFYGDMEVVGDAEVAETRFWGPEHKGDVWGVAGAPPSPFRA
ncbi:VOC family protein [Pigmentiphaga daeguensis]|uniref:VOC family protein n=1 Tax=Pigmentiphaga daeguensis TaxID=414049 RepID=A0ABP3M754_9BURK